MNKLVKWMPVVIIMILIIISIGYVQEDEQEESETTQQSTEQQTSGNQGLVDKPASNFQLENLQGEQVELSDFKGQKVLVNFWATWCPPCEAEMPDIQKLHEAYPEYVILAVNEDPENDVQGFVNEYGLTFPVLIDTNQQVQANYQIVAYPTSIFIDEDGVVRTITEGSMDYQSFEATMADL